MRKNDEFWIKNEELCIENEELCIENEGSCIKNDEFCSDHNPKDFVLFDAAALQAVGSMRDNTGQGPGGEYAEDIVFPTLAFPSDHALVATTLRER